MTETKESKAEAAEAVYKALENYTNKYKEKVEIICNICAYDDNFEMIDFHTVMFGVKESLQMWLADIQKELEKKKEEFIC